MWINLEITNKLVRKQLSFQEAAGVQAITLEYRGKEHNEIFSSANSIDNHQELEDL